MGNSAHGYSSTLVTGYGHGKKKGISYDKEVPYTPFSVSRRVRERSRGGDRKPPKKDNLFANKPPKRLTVSAGRQESRDGARGGSAPQCAELSPFLSPCDCANKKNVRFWGCFAGFFRVFDTTIAGHG